MSLLHNLKPAYIYYKDRHSFEERLTEYKKIHERFPDKIPIILEKGNDKTYDITNIKYLLIREMTMGQFIYDIRKRINLKKEEALLFFIKNTIPVNTEQIVSIYEKYKDADGFLYIKYTNENTFG